LIEIEEGLYLSLLRQYFSVLAMVLLDVMRLLIVFRLPRKPVKFGFDAMGSVELIRFFPELPTCNTPLQRETT
jgi:hypothetical protein